MFFRAATICEIFFSFATPLATTGGPEGALSTEIWMAEWCLHWRKVLNVKTIKLLKWKANEIRTSMAKRENFGSHSRVCKHQYFEFFFNQYADLAENVLSQRTIRVLHNVKIQVDRWNVRQADRTVSQQPQIFENFGIGLGHHYIRYLQRFPYCLILIYLQFFRL